MLINEKTKISQLLKHHKDALETIVPLSPDFKKLRNPLLRRLMAARTTIKMAAKMGGCTPEDFYRVLQPLGFEHDVNAGGADEKIVQKPMPDYLKSKKPEQIVTMDVRQTIKDGEDPLRSIQKKVKELKPGEVLKIINSFEPVPLIELLGKQHYKTHTVFVADEEVETYFYKEDGSGGAEIQTGDASNSADWEETLKRFEGNMQTVDVRALEMPGPMMTILETLESMPDGKALYVYHKRVPIFLLSELKDREYEYRIKDVQEGEVYLIIFKKS